MEPVTHMLTGAVLARAGFNRRAAYATLTMLVAAEFPDVDICWNLLGPVTGLEHHRGITHTLVAIPLEAALLVGLVWVVHRLRSRKGKPLTKAPTDWLWLYAGTLLALASHILLDWTNNYGVRPFFPFDPHWYAGSFVFIFEPVLFLILVAALVGPGLSGLIGSEIGARKPLFRGRPSAIAALVAIAALYLFRFDQHTQAVKQATAVAPSDTTRISASPYPLNPFLWHTVTATPAADYLAERDTRHPELTPDPLAGDPASILLKPQSTLAVLAAKRTYLGRIYLDWSQFPVLSEQPDGSDPNHPITAITFHDARYDYAPNLLGLTPAPGGTQTLSGTVLLDMGAAEGQRVVETRMGGRTQPLAP